MPRTPDMRVSVAKYNQSYVQRIASSLTCTHTEAVNFMIAQLRLGGSVSSESVDKIVDIASTQVEYPQLDVSFSKEFYQEMDEVIDQFVPDPIIERLLEEGLELSF